MSRLAFVSSIALATAFASCVGPARDESDHPLRIGVHARAVSGPALSPLSYAGGFLTKSLVFETLVQRDASGQLVPGLASSWAFEDDDRTLVLELREGATFHDGTAVSADAVALHLRRWVGLPEHSWLRSSDAVLSWEVRGPRTLAIHTSRPAALLPDLCALNPTAVSAPACFDDNGERVAVVGSGDYRLAGAREGGRVLHYTRWEQGPTREGELSERLPRELELVCLERDEIAGAWDRLRTGELDVLSDSWSATLPRAEAAGFESDERFEVLDVPGTTLVYLSFRLDAGPTSRAELRRQVAEAVDRDALVERVEHGWADQARSWSAPGLTAWPSASASALPASSRRASPSHAASPRSEPGGDSAEPLRLIVPRGDVRRTELGRALVAQLEARGLRVVVRELDPEDFADALAEREFELRIEQTWGLPYDPWISLTARFLAPTTRPSAATRRHELAHAGVEALVRRGSSLAREVDRREIFVEIQRLLEAETLVVPLYAPRRLFVQRRGVAGFATGPVGVEPATPPPGPARR